jgi:hypothetical protein
MFSGTVIPTGGHGIENRRLTSEAPYKRLGRVERVRSLAGDPIVRLVLDGTVVRVSSGGW